MSREGHKRFKLSRRLQGLIKREVNIFSDNEGFSKEFGRLEFRGENGSSNNGFYLDNIQIPVRSVIGIESTHDTPKLIVNMNYLKEYQGGY